MTHPAALPRRASRAELPVVRAASPSGPAASDRVKKCLLLRRISGYGPKWKWSEAASMSAFRGGADADREGAECRLLTHSGLGSSASAEVCSLPPEGPEVSKSSSVLRRKNQRPLAFLEPVEDSELVTSRGRRGTEVGGHSASSQKRRMPVDQPRSSNRSRPTVIGAVGSAPNSLLVLGARSAAARKLMSASVICAVLQNRKTRPQRSFRLLC